jgi:hypothetical protein
MAEPGTIDLRQERRRRLEAELARLRTLERLQVLDRSDADIAIAALENELDALTPPATTGVSS